MSIPSKFSISNSRLCQRQKRYPLSIEFRFVFIVCFLIFSFFHHDASAKQKNRSSIFIMNEYSGDDSIKGFGVSTLHKFRSSDIGFEVDMSLSTAEISTGKSSTQDYIAWELGGKIGYFSDVFIYGEFGFDLAELAFQDRDEEIKGVYYCDNNENFCHSVASNYYRNSYDESNDIDVYLGVGGGIDIGHLQVTAYTRYRQVDGAHWAAEGTMFSGVKLALSF